MSANFLNIELLFEKGFMYIHFHSKAITPLCISLEVSEIEIDKLGDLFSYMFIFVYLFLWFVIHFSRLFDLLLNIYR